MEYLRIDNLDNELETELITFTPLSLETNSGDRIDIQFLKHREVLSESFKLPGSILIPVGQSDFGRVRLSIQTAQHRRFALEFEGEAGDFFDGRRLDAMITLLESK